MQPGSEHGACRRRRCCPQESSAIQLVHVELLEQGCFADAYNDTRGRLSISGALVVGFRADRKGRFVRENQRLLYGVKYQLFAEKTGI
jgi:hypothetical protein